MFRFKKKQKIFEISGLKIGGQPGQLPTVMVGSMFYSGQKVVHDERTGEFDRLKAEELLREEEEASIRTGNPRAVDVIAASPRAMEKFIDFVAENTTGPFFIDGAGTETKIAGATYVAEVGLAQRAIYNSITYSVKPEELEAIRNADIKSAILLAYNPKKPTLEGRTEILKGTPEAEGLLQIAEAAKIENPLVDAAIIDAPEPGIGARFIYRIKKDYGLPAGCGAHNATHMLQSYKKLDAPLILASNIVAQVLPVLMGANFALYGPIESSPSLYQAIAMADAYIAYRMRQEYRIAPLTRGHPLFKVFR